MSSPVFHLGLKSGMAPPIIRGTLSCTPGTQLGVYNTHPPQLGYKQNQLSM